ncbi:hypothetical protein ONA23_05545 [Mycoplasmopsis cynos]|uniref:hypothetical protein n=1 Tax=Mycoplasmopsis cynos TaxID=171284 RepID=UPI0024C79346|nr:hypothetical protein [Mycoplasmopsis cynos]WAM06414.1 hypothetical protein ONA23_05545 [Mycoplasmopsis cynos]
MDVFLSKENYVFKYRVGSIIKNDDKVLLAYDGETNNYKYLPGIGRIWRINISSNWKRN